MNHNNTRARFLFVAAFILPFLISCNRDEVETSEPAAPVETGAPNTSYQPAFSGQTRVQGLITRTNYRTRILTRALQNPWGIAALPDGRLLVTEKGGRMRVVTVAGELGQPITGIPAVQSSGQGGLLGLCLDPAFGTNRMVYWVFSEAVEGGSLTSVAKGRLSDNETQIENVSIIYRATPAYNGTLHFGARVIFDRSGHLLVSTGERSDMATRPQAQSLESNLGKILRITTNGEPAPGNPFMQNAEALPELYSIGHRNPQGIAIHPVSGALWQSEHGPRGGDELNQVLAGADYGWPVITYGIEYGGETIGQGIQQQEGMEQPVYYWDPVISPSGMTFYSGDGIAEWRNNLFIGSLSGMHIVRLVIENNKVVGEERLLANEQQRFRDITEGIDGALYTITDQGRLYQIAVQ